MSLIDTSYFKGPIAIAQLGQQAVKNNLQLFINRYEAKLLQACLGYELYQDFIDGLNQSLIDQKWLDIRDGAIFDATGQWPPLYWQVPYLNSYMRDWYIPMNPRRRMEWIGFTAKASFIDTDASRDQTLVLTVDSGNNNPVSGTNTFSL